MANYDYTIEVARFRCVGSKVKDILVKVQLIVKINPIDRKG